MKLVQPTKEYLESVWQRVQHSKGIWASLDGNGSISFYKACLSADVLIDLDFGLAFASNLKPGHSCDVHGVFWSKEIVKDKEKVPFALNGLASTYKLRRIECIVPSELKTLSKLLNRWGFTIEGCMKDYYKTSDRFIDGLMYAILY